MPNSLITRIVHNQASLVGIASPALTLLTKSCKFSIIAPIMRSISMKKIIFISLFFINIYSMQDKYHEVITFDTNQNPFGACFEQTTNSIYIARENIENWDLKGNMLASIKSNEQSNDIGASRFYIASSNELVNNVYVYDRTTGKKITTIGSGKIKSLHGMTMDSTRSTIAVWDMPDDETNMIKLFNINGEMINQFPLAPDLDSRFFDFNFNQNGQLILAYRDSNSEEQKIAIYEPTGYPDYVWDAQDPFNAWPSPACDAEGNIILPGWEKGNNIYYYQPNGVLKKILTGSASFHRPVVSNRDDTIYYIKNAEGIRSTTMVALDPETNTNTGELSITNLPDETNKWIFLDQFSNNIIMLISNHVHIIAKDNK